VYPKNPPDFFWVRTRVFEADLNAGCRDVGRHIGCSVLTVTPEPQHAGCLPTRRLRPACGDGRRTLHPTDTHRHYLY